MNSKLITKLHTIILITLIIIGFLGLLIPLVIQEYSLILFSSYLSIPILLACYVYLAKSKVGTRQETQQARGIRSYLLIYAIVFMASITTLLIFEVRSIAYYISASILASIIFVEIITLNLRKHYPIILAQTVLLTMNMILSTTIKYDYFIGRADILFHLNLIDNLRQLGFVTNIFDVYKPFPLWHIFNTIALDITNMSIPTQKLIFLLSGLEFGAAILLVFALTRYITKDLRLALLTSLLVGIFPDFVFLGMYSIPRSATVVLELLLILFLVKRMSIKSLLLTLLITFTIVVYHTTVILFIMSLIILIAIIMRVFPNNGINLTWKYFLGSFSILSIYWAVFARDLMTQLVTTLYTQIMSTTIIVSLGRQALYPVNEVFNYIQYGVIIFLIIIGALYAIPSTRLSNTLKAMAILGFLAVVVSFPGPIDLLRSIAYNLQILRFSEVTWIFTNLAAAIGLIFIYSRTSKRYRNIIIAMFFVFALLSVSNEFVATDNPLVKRQFYTDYFTNSEITSMKEAASLAEGFVFVDHPALRYISYRSANSHIIESSLDGATLLRNSRNDITLVRVGELKKRPLLIYTNDENSFILYPSFYGHLEYYSEDSPIWRSLLMQNTVYNSGQIFAYN